MCGVNGPEITGPIVPGVGVDAPVPGADGPGETGGTLAGRCAQSVEACAGFFTKDSLSDTQAYCALFGAGHGTQKFPKPHSMSVAPPSFPLQSQMFWLFDGSTYNPLFLSVVVHAS